MAKRNIAPNLKQLSKIKKEGAADRGDAAKKASRTNKSALKSGNIISQAKKAKTSKNKSNESLARKIPKDRAVPFKSKKTAPKKKSSIKKGGASDRAAALRKSKRSDQKRLASIKKGGASDRAAASNAAKSKAISNDYSVKIAKAKK